MISLMDAAGIARWRMRNVGLSGPRASGYTEVIRRLGAVQAQDYGPAKWSLGQRTVGASDSLVDEAFSAGTILRTHVLRPTWHFVLPEDLLWLLELTAARVHALNRYYYRQQGLDGALQKRCSSLIAAALKGENYLTKAEIKLLLEGAGIESAGLRLGYIMIHAELERLFCSGPLRGKQQTYALVEERVADVATHRTRDESLAELTWRYFSSHGPATVKDFRWWSSLTTSDISRGLYFVGDRLMSEVFDGETYWFEDREHETGRNIATPPQVQKSSSTVHLVQAYDEYVVGYTRSKFLLDLSGAARSRSPTRAIFNHIILLDSQVAGHWKRAIKKGVVRIEAVLDAPFNEAQGQALLVSAEQHAAFLGLSVELSSGT
jgi:Winged helix DNA-binding domain